ncbi:hypothetical protein BC826DRAFT_1103541 [Russula brevipes]|nr:hypothetical protein BC826DRAFT_1103541 [Russula brevipes]
MRPLSYTYLMLFLAAFVSAIPNPRVDNRAEDTTDTFVDNNYKRENADGQPLL